VKIVRVETLESRTYPNLLWVQVHTDEGLVGLGETFFGPAAVAAYIHETAAPICWGRTQGRSRATTTSSASA
jgi:galactonate dehydratase